MNRPSLPTGREMKRAFDNASSLVGEDAHRKRPKNDPMHQSNTPLRFLVVHKVLCSRHNNHPPESELYKDTPRLYRGDDRTAQLRGTTILEEDVLSEEFAEENPDVSFIVIREYDCGVYHDAARDQFKHIPVSDNMIHVLRKFKLQLTMLNEDASEANPVAERIALISEGVSSGMKSVRSAYPSYFLSSDPAIGDLMAPYPDFYHGRTILTEESLDSLGDLDEEQKGHVVLLSGYVQSSCASDYKEADEQFQHGVVSKMHFDKLFSPEDIVIRSTEAGPRAYCVRRVETTPLRIVRLDCWSWAFDGKFYRDHSRWDIPWAARADEVSIDSLPLYPLRLGSTRLRNQLHERGKVYWEFRNRKMVEYNSLNSGFELQPVSRAPRYYLTTTRLTITLG